MFRTSKSIIALLVCIVSIAMHGQAQLVEQNLAPNIATIQLYQYGNQLELPVYTIGSAERISLEFDDLNCGLKNYYYTYQLCDYNWKPVDLNPFDYIKGFTQNRINTYRYSSLAYTRYTHYQAILPEQNSTPTRSGNYLLEVFLDGDRRKPVFTKQMLVLEAKSTISAEVVQPFSANLFSTHQKLRFTASAPDLNSFSAAQQVKAVILQNNRWDNAQRDIAPTFVRGNSLQYDTETSSIFPGGKEWRWLDLRSFRLQSDRIDHADYGKAETKIYVKPDIDRRPQKYVYFADINGMFVNTTYESINPFWQGDYATVQFSFVTPDGKPLPNEDLYLAGMFTGYRLTDQWKMQWNDSAHMYMGSTFMKQGYYNYAYIAVDKNDPKKATMLEGDYWETENSYTILLYYKSFTDRTDRLIGLASINSRRDRPGFSF